jgi:glutamate synthase domain-containing protein 3
MKFQKIYGTRITRGHNTSRFTGSAGQSFGAFATNGLSFKNMKL